MPMVRGEKRAETRAETRPRGGAARIATEKSEMIAQMLKIVTRILL